MKQCNVRLSNALFRFHLDSHDGDILWGGWDALQPVESLTAETRMTGRVCQGEGCMAGLFMYCFVIFFIIILLCKLHV